jgi:hypothetical protein
MTWRMPAPEVPATFARIRARMAEKQKTRMVVWHRDHRYHGYPEGVWEALGYKTKKHADLHLDRGTFSQLVQMRTNHGDYPAYHERFRHKDYAPLCACGMPKRREHLAYCRKVRKLSESQWPVELRHRSGGRPTTRMGPGEVFLEVLINGKAFAALARASAFFSKLCPHVSTRIRNNDDLDDQGTEPPEEPGNGGS